MIDSDWLSLLQRRFINFGGIPIGNPEQTLNRKSFAIKGNSDTKSAESKQSLLFEYADIVFPPFFLQH